MDSIEFGATGILKSENITNIYVLQSNHDNHKFHYSMNLTTVARRDATSRQVAGSSSDEVIEFIG
jgi:hypothetical protein